jgi:hypothetical protein
MNTSYVEEITYAYVFTSPAIYCYAYVDDTMVKFA